MKIIKLNLYIGFFSLLINQISAPSFNVIRNYDPLIKGYSANFITTDSYFGIIFDFFVHFLFNVNLHNISDCLKIYGVI